RIWNHYRRITLVSKETPERVTLDIDLAFLWQTQQAALPGIVIAEVKRPVHGERSPFVELMRSKHIHRSSFSKYCMGVNLLGLTHRCVETVELT
ncbi:MAG: VTC domain-containing protein, partial [Caldilineaceae bacterium]